LNDILLTEIFQQSILLIIMTQQITATTYITITAGLRGGQPHIAGTRITVSDIVIMHLKLGQSVPEIAGDYNLSLASIYAALTYYYDHQEEIEQRMADDEAFAEAFKQQHPSKLQARLKQLQYA
jgi:uncharacterized protein (DUF433 family)